MHEKLENKQSSPLPFTDPCLILICHIKPGVLDQMFVLAEFPNTTFLFKSAISPASNAVSYYCSPASMFRVPTISFCPVDKGTNLNLRTGLNVSSFLLSQFQGLFGASPDIYNVS